jgi:predicted aconitase
MMETLALVHTGSATLTAKDHRHLDGCHALLLEDAMILVYMRGLVKAMECILVQTLTIVGSLYGKL